MNNLQQLLYKISIRDLRKHSQEYRKLLQEYRKYSIKCTSEIPKPITYLTADETRIKETVSRLANEKIKPYVRQMEKEEKIHESVINMLFENGLMGVEIDSKYSGSGGNFMTLVLVAEELAKIDLSVSGLVEAHNNLVCNLLSNHGNEKQKEKYLPLLTTKSVGSICISEPDSGSDAFAMKTKAKIDGNDYVINGSKTWITNSNIADIFLVMANANPEAGHKGITCFIVERNTPGLIVDKPINKLGGIASGTCPVHFDNVRVPKQNIVGKIGEGYKYMADILNEGRIAVAAQMLGVAQGCFNVTIPYTLQRTQFGKPIFKFQAMQHQIARIATEIECTRTMVYNVARLQENGYDVRKHGAMAKLFASEVAQRVTTSCIDWLGGVGFTKDFPQEKFYRDCKVGSIIEGSSNILLNTIAKIIEDEY